MYRNDILMEGWSGEHARRARLKQCAMPGTVSTAFIHASNPLTRTLARAWADDEVFRCLVRGLAARAPIIVPEFAELYFPDYCTPTADMFFSYPQPEKGRGGLACQADCIPVDQVKIVPVESALGPRSLLQVNQE